MSYYDITAEKQVWSVDNIAEFFLNEGDQEQLDALNRLQWDIESYLNKDENNELIDFLRDKDWQGFACIEEIKRSSQEEEKGLLGPLFLMMLLSNNQEQIDYDFLLDYIKNLYEGITYSSVISNKIGRDLGDILYTIGNKQTKQDEKIKYYQSAITFGNTDAETALKEIEMEQVKNILTKANLWNNDMNDLFKLI